MRATFQKLAKDHQKLLGFQYLNSQRSLPYHLQHITNMKNKKFTEVLQWVQLTIPRQKSTKSFSTKISNQQIR